MELPVWLDRAAPTQLGVFLSKQASRRKARFFARHLCQCFAYLFADPRSLAALNVAERYDDDELGKAEIQAAIQAADQACIDAAVGFDTGATGQPDANRRASSATVAAYLAHHVALMGYYKGFLPSLRHAILSHAGGRAPPRKNPISPVMRPVFYEHFGDIENPVTLDPSWRTEAVVALAAGVYADRAFDRLPVLADALEDAGCGNADVLAHCRVDGPHARGCWVVDLLLGKA